MKPFIPFMLSMLIAPCHAGELDTLGPSTQLYVRVPLGASAPKERAPSYGLAIRGRHDYQVFTLDSRMLDAFAFDGGLIGGIEVKWLLVGGAAAVGAIAVSRKGGGGSSSGPSKEGTPPPSQQGNPPAQQSTQGAPPPSNCPQTCAKAF